jgi:purine-nucleoside phosphorylase
MLSAAGSALPEANPAPPSEGYLLAHDHLALEGASVLRGLSDSNLGPLFPDQGGVHLDSVRHELLQVAAKVGLNCTEGVLACVPGPALETPAERAYHARAGAHASAQNLSGLFHAMAHAGLGGLCLTALLGTPDAKLEDLLAAADRLAPGLLELLMAAIPLLAAHSRSEAEEQL